QGKALKTTSDLLYGKTYDAARTKALHLPPNVDGAAFRGKDGSYTYVLWARTATDKSESASASYAFPVSFTGNRIVRMEWDYAASNIAAPLNSKTVKLGSTP